MNNNLVPPLRFAGFEGDWEKRHFSDVAETRRGLTYSPDDVSNSGIRVLRSSNISEDRFVFGEDDVFVAPEAINIPYAHNGDILITAANGSTRLVGKHAIIKDISEESAVHGGFMLLASADNPDFVNALMSAPWYSKFISLYVAGGNGAIGNLNKCDLDEQEIFVPRDPEQKAIGLFFGHLDELTSQYQHQYENLLHTKKAMLLKMFPRPGKAIPEMRFTGFTAPWEQCKLGDIASSFEYGLNAAAKEYDGVNKYLRITDIDDSSRAFRDDDLTSPDVDLSIADNYQLHEGEILFARTGASVGKSYIYRESDGLVYFAGFLIRAKIKPEYDTEFVYQNTLCTTYEKYIQITSRRSGQPGVNAQEYAEYSFLLPSYAEQKAIGSFLHQIDNLITLHQRKLNNLRNLKKAMLQKMFPAFGRK